MSCAKTEDQQRRALEAAALGNFELEHRPAHAPHYGDAGLRIGAFSLDKRCDGMRAWGCIDSGPGDNQEASDNLAAIEAGKTWGGRREAMSEYQCYEDGAKRRASTNATRTARNDE